MVLEGCILPYLGGGGYEWSWFGNTGTQAQGREGGGVEHCEEQRGAQQPTLRTVESLAVYARAQIEGAVRAATRL